MHDRSPEEIALLLQDFQMIKSFWDKEVSGVNTKSINSDFISIEESKKFFSFSWNPLSFEKRRYKANIKRMKSKFVQFLREHDLKTCEGISLINNCIKELQQNFDSPPLKKILLGSYYKTSGQWKPSNDLSLKKIVNLLEENIISARLLENLDKISTCTLGPIAQSSLSFGFEKALILPYSRFRKDHG